MNKKKAKQPKAADNSSSNTSAENKANNAAEYQVITFFEQKIVPYWRPLIWGVLVIILAAILLFRFAASREAEKAAAYSQMDNASSIEELRILASEYEGEELSAMALLREGRMLLQEEEDYDEAASAFEQVAKKFPASEFRIPALLGQAYALEAQGKYGDALTVFEEVVEQAKSDPAILAPAWSGIGRNALALSREEDARSAFSNVLDLVDNGPYAEQAQEFLRDIEVDAVNVRDESEANDS